jgi:hypothetical protein
MRNIIKVLLVIILSFGCKTKTEVSYVYYNYNDTIIISLLNTVIYLPLNLFDTIDVGDGVVRFDNFIISQNQPEHHAYYCDLRLDSSEYDKLINYINLFTHSIDRPP